MQTTVAALSIYYEVHGAGEPMALIRGIGSSGYVWGRFAEDLARQFRILWFDNRGVGRTAAPPGPYTMRQMADDTAGLLREVSHVPAHVVGVSLGGMIAQELAIDHPEVVRSLVLGCTDFGGPGAVRPQTAAQGLAPGTDAEESARRAARAIYSPEWLRSNPDEVAEITARRAAYPASPTGFEAQRQAYLGHDTAGRLGAIRAPVLILTGTADGVVPAENSGLLAARIAGAELITYPGAGHGFFDERRPQVVADIAGFIGRRAR